MKLKNLAIAAISGLFFAASFAYAAPVKLVADDAGASSGSAMSGNVGSMSGSSNSANSNSNSMSGTGNTAASGEGSSSDSSSSNSNDDMSADTATGDDDY
jgi:hypothetical protein